MTTNINPDQFVPKYYVMDPETDVLLFDGSELQIGMHVLVGDESCRFDPDMLKTIDEPPVVDDSNPMAFIGALMTARGNSDKGALIDGLNECNRWCEIIRVELTEPEEHDGHRHSGGVMFVGQYIDGSQRKRGYPSAVPWIARKFSLPGATTALEVPDSLEGIDGL